MLQPFEPLLPGQLPLMLLDDDDPGAERQRVVDAAAEQRQHAADAHALAWQHELQLMQWRAAGDWEARCVAAQADAAVARGQLARATADLARTAAQLAEAAQPYAASGECAVCLDKPRSVVLQPCKHLVLCTTCVQALQPIKGRKRKACPVCRTPFGCRDWFEIKAP